MWVTVWTKKHKHCISPTRFKTACKPWASHTNKHTPSYYMYTPEFHSYYSVILLSDLDFVALGNEHIFMMRWYQTRVNSRRDGSITISPAQEYIRVIKCSYQSHGLVCEMVNNSVILFDFAHEGRNRVGCGLVCHQNISQKRDANYLAIVLS